jgi:hypothetical protein
MKKEHLNALFSNLFRNIYLLLEEVSAFGKFNLVFNLSITASIFTIFEGK